MFHVLIISAYKKATERQYPTCATVHLEFGGARDEGRDYERIAHRRQKVIQLFCIEHLVHLRGTCTK